ncbi:hypothetical protein ZIOFF_007836 [Zingiber officinale]|uniref:RING-type E3 ubiquitin transferase n=1 Tax=Zingiber officinale TaxID=94328 RepID=A0A8J5HXR5_ZINOF|nr:hypothetical protein ZIOFF_007836 [Zingiber officinale]
MEDFFWLGRGGGGGANGGVIFRSTSSLHLQRRPRGGGRVSWNFPSFLVRATAGRFVASPMLADATPDTDARQIADPPYNWGYSKPVVVLDVAWNSLFVLVSAAVLLWASRERPETPIRAWVLGYAVQCLLHVGFVCCEAVKKLESLNAIMSLFWWMLGFYWIVVGGQALLQDAPRLYWLTVVFLAFDMFFAVFCVMLACAVGIALCCCLPCLIAFVHAIVGQEGASDTNLSNLPRFRYCQNNQLHKLGQENENEISITIAEEDSSLMDLCLPPEDSVYLITQTFSSIFYYSLCFVPLLVFFPVTLNAAFASLITKMAWSYTHFPATITSIQIALLNGSRLVPHAPSASSIYSEDHDEHLLRDSNC